MKRKHSHYFHDVSKLDVLDVYRVLELFSVTDQAVGHAIKKLLCAGIRGAKDQRKDISEAVDTLVRRLEMMDEDAEGAKVMFVGEDSRPEGTTFPCEPDILPTVKMDASDLLPVRYYMPDRGFRVLVSFDGGSIGQVGLVEDFDWSLDASPRITSWRYA